MTKKSFLFVTFISCLVILLEAKSVKKQLGDLAQTAKEKVKDTAETVKEKVEDFLHRVKEVTDENFDHLLNQATKPFIIYFYRNSDQTPLAKQFEKMFKDIAKSHSDVYHFVTINVDNAPAVTKRLKINKVPAIVVIKDTSVYLNTTDYIKKEDLIKKIELSLKRRTTP